MATRLCRLTNPAFTVACRGKSLVDLALRSRYQRSQGANHATPWVHVRYYSGNDNKDDKKNEQVSNQVKKKDGGKKSGLSYKKVVAILKGALDSTLDVIFNPRETWKSIKEVAAHYWMGSKLLWSEIKLAYQIVIKVLKGEDMSRRERIQLLRTTTDLFRLIPFSLFIIIPFMELFLPLALKFFPNMLPSTFEDSLKKEKDMKRELQMRLAVANFLQDTMKEIAKKKTSSSSKSDNGSESEAGASDVLSFIEKSRKGEAVSNEEVLHIAKLFKDELTLDNIHRPQLVSMCQYMGLQPYGADVFLRFQLRIKLNTIKEDDRRILWEGLDSLNTFELRDACRERGMRSLDLTHFQLKKQLQEWLQLSIQRSIPISLLIMSRAFNIGQEFDTPEETPENLLKRSMSSLDLDIVNEVVISAASTQEDDTPEIRKRKLESIEFQKEMMAEEKKEEGSKKAKEEIAVEMAEKPFLPLPKETTVATPTPDKVVSDASSGERKASSKTSTGASEGKQAGAGAIDLQAALATVKLTVEEIEAVCDLARGSVLFREKSALAALQATLELSSDSAKAMKGNGASGSSYGADEYLEDTGRMAMIVNPLNVNHFDIFSAYKQQLDEKAERKKRDNSINAVQNVVTNMLTKLQTKMQNTEESIGDKVSLLDLDNDGELFSEEIRDALSKISNRPNIQDEAEAFIKILDTDGDGKVSLVELLQYARKLRENMEVIESPSSNTPSESKS